MVASPASLARASITSAAPLVELVQRRLAGAYVVDPWGLDREVHALAAGAARLRWTVAVSGGAHLPVSGGDVAAELTLGHAFAQRGQPRFESGERKVHRDDACKQQGLLPDQRARLSFANEVARQHGRQPK